MIISLKILQEYPQKIASQEEAEQLVSDACRLRIEYEDTKAQCLLHLQQLLVDMQKVDLQLFKVDLHIGRLQHLICKSGLQEVPPIIVRSRGKKSLSLNFVNQFFFHLWQSPVPVGRSLAFWIEGIESGPITTILSLISLCFYFYVLPPCSSFCPSQNSSLVVYHFNI
jgi:hypothetical protein